MLLQISFILKGSSLFIKMVRVILFLTGKIYWIFVLKKIVWNILTYLFQLKWGMRWPVVAIFSRQNKNQYLFSVEMKQGNAKMTPPQQTHMSSSVSFISVSHCSSVPEKMQIVPDQQHWTILSTWCNFKCTEGWNFTYKMQWEPG